jgi:hypothetical protein
MLSLTPTSKGVGFRSLRVTSDTPPSVDGFAIGEPTGEIECCECGAAHCNVDEIPHDADCSQRFVRSHWWVEHVV